MTTSLESIIRNHFGVNTKIIKEIDEGVETSYIIETTDTYFIKFSTSGYFEPEGFICGGKLLPIIEQNSTIPAPKLKTTSFDIQDYPYKIPFYATEFIDGEYITGYDPELPQSFYESFFKEIGQYNAEYNNIQIESEKFGWAGWFDNTVQPFGGHTKFIDFLLQRMNDSLRKIPKDSPLHTIKEPTLEKLSDIKELQLDFTAPCLTNIDIKFTNMIFNTTESTKDSIRCVVDWDNPVIGTVAYNLAKTERHLSTDYCKQKFTKQNKFDIFIQSYCENSTFDVQPTILDSVRMDICRLEDLLNVAKHFNTYYDHLSESEKENATDYYEAKIFDILNTI